MVTELFCWRCGASIEGYEKPWPRSQQCEQCHADLHVCRQCRFYNPRISDHCDEPLARGSVRETDRANFCDYFEPEPDAFQARSPAAAQAKAKLASLFGEEEEAEGKQDGLDAARAELDKLFDK